jgi:hypothetical protein
MAYGKKTLGQKFNAAARKFLLWTGLLAGAATPFAYEYGTVETQTVQVTGYKSNDDNTAFTFYTDKGDFNAERSRLHFQSKEDAAKLYSDINYGYYDITTYGWHIGGSWQPNILKAKAVSEDEMKKRQDAFDKKNSKDSKSTTTTTQPVTNANTTPTALSGQMVTANVIVNGYNVQITIPVEAAGKVTINSVAPVVQANNVVPPVNTVNPPANNSGNTPTP